MVAPVIQAIGAGLSAFSAIKSLTDSSGKASPADSASTSASSASAPSRSTATASSAAEIQDRFLKLLVAQMRHQDPLNPLDNAQVTTQLAQISTVSGLDKLNASLSGLTASLMSAQSAQSASLIGRQVYASGSTLALGAAGNKATAAVDVKEPATSVSVVIADANGALVRRLELGARAVGTTTFEWDGKADSGIKAPAGTYVFQVSAVRGNTAVAAEPLSVGKVNGVSVSDGMMLTLDSGGNVALNDIKRIF
jgi:flagellar basal-body rod modification protein FlgD